jgi:hypothetical protein
VRACNTPSAAAHRLPPALNPHPTPACAPAPAPGIGRLVAEAQSREAPVQRLADAVAGRFCYGVMAASALTFAFWQLIGARARPRRGGPPAARFAATAARHSQTHARPRSAWPKSLPLTTHPPPPRHRPTTGTELFPSALAAAPNGTALLLSIKLAVDVLVVACPCALGLATPTAVLVASSMGARRGLLLRGGDVLERVAGVQAVVLDKTGTLTQGKLQLASVRLPPGQPGGGADGGSPEDRVLALAAAVEASTRHPLADAVASAAATRKLELPQVTAPVTTPGCGVAAEVGGEPVLVGRPGWVLEQLPAGEAEAVQRMLASAGGGGEKQTVVVVAAGGRALGVLGFKDTLRPDAIATVAALQEMGIRCVRHGMGRGRGEGWGFAGRGRFEWVSKAPQLFRAVPLTSSLAAAPQGAPAVGRRRRHRACRRGAGGHPRGRCARRDVARRQAGRNPGDAGGLAGGWGMGFRGFGGSQYGGGGVGVAPAGRLPWPSSPLLLSPPLTRPANPCLPLPAGRGCARRDGRRRRERRARAGGG